MEKFSVHMKIFESHAFPHLWFLNVGVQGDHQLVVIDSCCCHVSTLCTLVLLVFPIVTAAYVVLDIFEAYKLCWTYLRHSVPNQLLNSDCNGLTGKMARGLRLGACKIATGAL
jgi:hypothetical protein